MQKKRRKDEEKKKKKRKEKEEKKKPGQWRLVHQTESRARPVGLQGNRGWPWQQRSPGTPHSTELEERTNQSSQKKILVDSEIMAFIWSCKTN